MIRQVSVELTVDGLAEHLVRLTTNRLLDPLAILLESDDAVAKPRAQVERAARGWAEVMLGGDHQAAVMLAVRFSAMLFPADEPVEPSRQWWATPLGRVVAWRVGHPSRRHVPYEIAGAMLGITRQGVGDLVNRNKLRRHPDGGVDVDSIRARLAALMTDTPNP
ncbi:hypothetical protein [Stackebrandtia nassauensis]|uniref:MftR C-terminal domain-containing protein n=1 Tax=Stackebrandtia nassauensis (strain DSM 44728 / CIP 108903 / NRRL B-16338 / NBRC 102104 / LLR-40K-21) TaxID=446470 RepID=D3PY91_STANL|nr:hypothetical protein [Stackebrandtia nassauensis]ADD41458.1 hypothetical protein Snas_1760 [Stackebrandtia nassauensis DSM 44728]